MARGLNKVLLIGNLGKDPEMKYTPQGTAVATFSVAVSRSWKDRSSDEWKEETEWFRVVAWEKLAETCNEYLRKGSKVYVEGRLQTRKWEGQDGQTREMVEVVASEVLRLESRQGAGAPATAGAGFAGEERAAPRPSGKAAGGFSGGNGFDDADSDADDIPF